MSRTSRDGFSKAKPFRKPAPNAPAQPIPAPKVVNVAKLKLQLGPTTPRPGALLLDKKRRPR